MSIHKHQVRPSTSIFFCCSVAKSCPTLCNTMDCSTPGSPVLHHLPESAQAHVLSQWCYLTISSSVIPFSCLPSFPASGFFPMSWFFALGGQIIGASALVLQMNVEGWFTLGLTGLISLLSKELSRVFSSTTVQRYQFFSTQPFLLSSSHIHTSLPEKPYPEKLPVPDIWLLHNISLIFS